ncbi:hypothetical protein KJ855_00895 [Patescibacteria group bacterium]|nr:hypothetical protein [Patescibacteria group bacterium]
MHSCQNCHTEFQITPENLEYYQKISVPYPTFCPDCRAIRRMQWRNERSLYKRKCDATGQNIISCFSPDKKLTVYEQKHWWSDKWNPLDFGQDYNFNRPFFEQWSDLFYRTPQLSVSNSHADNSDFCNVNSHSKDCYLISASFENERVMYSNRTVSNQDCLDSYILSQSQYCYEDTACQKCYQLHFSQDCTNCRESYFLYNCHNCQNCVGCTNLRNKQYHIFNQPYQKEEYEQELLKLNLSQRSGLDHIRNKFEQLKLKALRKYANLINCENCAGDNMNNCQNCRNCFDLADDVQNCHYTVWGGYNLQYAFDTGPGVGSNSSYIYEAYDSGINSNNLNFTGVVYDSSNIWYSLFCFNSKNLFGCVGLRHKEYCILNKQYSEQEYKQLVPKIIEHMNSHPYTDKRGLIYKYGEFYPAEISPYGYNETVAQEYYPTTKEKALANGYKWLDPPARQFQPTILHQNIPDNIKDVDESILNEVIECAHQGNCNEQCNVAFKILPAELVFYLKQNLPLPHLCPNCRHYQKVKQRNPLKLWNRNCQCAGSASDNNTYQNVATHEHHGTNHYPNQFETTHSPDRKEVIYCEDCCQKEIF